MKPFQVNAWLPRHVWAILFTFHESQWQFDDILLHFFLELPLDSFNEDFRLLHRELTNKLVTIDATADIETKNRLRAEAAKSIRDCLKLQSKESFNSVERVRIPSYNNFNHQQMLTSEMLRYLRKMENLRVLDLTNTDPNSSLTIIPESISRITSLQEIHLKNHHNLQKIPESIFNMPNVTVIADLDKIPWSHPLHLWSSIPWTEIKDASLIIAKVIVIFSAIVGLVGANMLLTCTPLFTLAAFIEIGEAVIVPCLFAAEMLSIVLIQFSLMGPLFSNASWQETLSVIGSLTFKITCLALTILVCFGVAYGLTLLANPYIPALAQFTGYAPELLPKAIEITAAALANIPICYAIYQTAMAIFNDEFQRVW